MNHKNNVCNCLINGKIYRYDLMGEHLKSYDKHSKLPILDIIFLGYGELYSINKVLQTSGCFGYFWKYKTYYPSTKQQKANIIAKLKKKHKF